MPPADLEIVEIVCRGDLYRAAARFRISVFVGDDRDQPVDERQPHELADQSGVAHILRMHRDTGVTQHRLRAGGGDDDVTSGFAVDRITDMPERPICFTVVDFEIGDHRVHLRVPVDEPLVAVDEAFAVERDENASYRRRQGGIHREALARPVGRGAEPAQLVDDRAARFLFPLPDPLDEIYAAEPLLVDLRLRELVCDDDLRGDAGMIGTGLPQHVATPHSLIADQHVLQRKGQRVTHMQAPGHVRGRHHDRIGQLAAVGVGRKSAGALPQRIAARLYGGGVISLVQHR